MRTTRKNKQRMKYSLLGEKIPTYETDDEGNIIYDDGEPIISGYVSGYQEPVDFLGNIAFAGGEAEAVAFGVSVSDYDSKLLMNADELPITETSIIFKDSEPVYKGGVIDDKSADYRVIKVIPSLNTTVYLLKRIVK